MELIIRKTDADTAKGYCDNKHCLLATAARRQCKTNEVSAGPFGITIKGVRYSIPTEAVDFLGTWPDFVVRRRFLKEIEQVKDQLPYTIKLGEARGL